MSGSPADTEPPRHYRVLAGIGRFLLGVLAILVIAYCFGAIYFDGPLGPAASTSNALLAWAWLVVVLVLLLAFRRRPLARWITLVVAVAAVLLPWSTIRPSNDRDWKPDFAETGWVEVEGDRLTFHETRNFDYTIDGEVTERWETRVHHLSKLEGIDYFHDAFGGDLLAHPIMSFDFGEEGHLCLSIETRRETTESFSTLGGLFKMFELQYIFGDERDFIRVRTNIRHEPVYLYHTRAGPAHAREMLMESISVQNEMREQPRFYNVLTSNCTTSIRAQTPSEQRQAFDWRMLVNGRLDEYVYETKGLVDGGLPFPELRAQALINEAAEAAHADPDFSGRVRAGRIGFD